MKKNKIDYKSVEIRANNLFHNKMRTKSDPFTIRASNLFVLIVYYLEMKRNEPMVDIAVIDYVLEISDFKKLLTEMKETSKDETIIIIAQHYLSKNKTEFDIIITTLKECLRQH